MIAETERTPRPRTASLTPRLFLAIIAGKSVGWVIRRLGRGGGTSLPGMIARRIDPDLLETIAQRRPVPIVAVTGSNGKTTTVRFTAALLRGEQVVASYDSTGSNLVQSVTSLALKVADLRGRLPQGVLLAEVDEGALPTIAREVHPSVVVVIDLFRDQLDRYGELYAVANAIAGVAYSMAPDAVWVSNVDDPLVAGMAKDVTARQVTFGLELDRSTDRITRAADTIRCPRCQSGLVYRQVYLSHLGDYNCPSCGFARPTADVAVTAFEARGGAETRLTARLPSGAIDLVVPQAGVHIAYDVAAALAVMVALGVEPTHAAESLASVGPAFGRLEHIQAGDRRIVLGFTKNPTSYNTTLTTLAASDEPRQLLVAVSNTRVDGEDFAWLWDVDFESVAGRLERVTASGTRADELANRLKYAGVDPARVAIVPDHRQALDAALAAVGPGGTLTILAGYTPTVALRGEMHRRGWVRRIWET